jgi:3'(2'), 5'-bisphosphate nucleotidase
MAEATGRLLLELRADVGCADAAELQAMGDRRAQEFLEQARRDHWQHDGFLSEEGVDDLDRLDHSRVWIVDPLDGTREYGEGRDDWAVHVALAVDGAVAAGAVALPAMGQTLATDVVSLRAREPGRLRVVVSRSRPPAEAEVIADALDAEVVAMGSAGAKAMAVIRGEVDVYVHAGGQYEWDSAAPAAVATAAGAHVSRLDGSPLQYNQVNPWLPDLVICRPELAGRVLAALRGPADAPGDGDVPVG